MADGSGMSGRSAIVFPRHGRARPGHPRLLLRLDCKDVDARDKPGHDGVYLGGGCYTLTAAFGQYLSRRCRFTSFPVGVRGSSASKSMLLGHLIGDKCLRQNTISSASSSLPALDMSCGCTTALTSSPISSFGTPNTATSATL